VDQYGDVLYTYALTRLRDKAKAEDAVQETFLAAWKARASYAGQSSEKGWLFGILKNKIADQLRKLSRETSWTDLQFLQDEQETVFQTVGWAKHSWAPEHSPQAWALPEPGLEKEEFWNVLHECTRKLPRRIAQVFLMREMEDLKTSEICEECKISSNHLWVMLHRARLALRRCLELNWFTRSAGKQATPADKAK
jgi:RNA polymerase sigma-70 factor (ECF subfamily)